jgi:hypothetical protein
MNDVELMRVRRINRFLRAQSRQNISNKQAFFGQSDVVV